MSQVSNDKESSGKCLFYLRNIATFLVSHIGLVSLVVGYCIMGAFVFVELESAHEKEVKKSISKIRENVTDDLWEITTNMSVLIQENWTLSVTSRLEKFEKRLIESMKKEGWDGNEDLNNVQWTIPGALFYSIILITTIGKNTLAFSLCREYYYECMHNVRTRTCLPSRRTKTWVTKGQIYFGNQT